MSYTKHKTLSEIILDNLKSILIFEKYDINFSTDGNRTLDEACNSAEIKTGILISELKKINGESLNNFKIKDWKLDFLCDYIVNNHHEYIRKAFPVMISALKEDMKSKKGISKSTDNIELMEKIYSDFEIQMQKEEKLLFPYIKKMVAAENLKADFDIAPFGLIRKPIEVIKKEHQNAIDNISGFKIICTGATVNKFSASGKKKNKFCDHLNEFIHDLNLHIHLENNILFPKAGVLEKKILKNQSYTKLKK